MNEYVFVTVFPEVIEVESITTLSLNQLTVGVGAPPVTVQVRVTESPLTITCGPVITGAPGGTAIEQIHCSSRFRLFIFNFVFIYLISQFGYFLGLTFLRGRANGDAKTELMK